MPSIKKIKNAIQWSKLSIYLIVFTPAKYPIKGIIPLKKNKHKSHLYHIWNV